MLEKLLKNPEKYFWSINNDGDLVLGNADLGLKAKLTLTLTKKWVNLAPLVENSPGEYIGLAETYLKDTKEYEQIAELYKKIKAQLKEPTLIEREKTSRNTLTFLLKYYQEHK